MISITEYAEDTGTILCVRGFSDQETYELNSQHPHVMGEYSSRTYYILNGQPTERPVQSTTLTGATLTDLPIPCTLQVNGEAFEVDDGEAELDFLLSGTYALRVEAWPYQDWDAEVTV